MHIRTILAATLTTTALVAGPLTATSTAAHAQAERESQPRTKLTFAVEDCEGCTIQLTSARGTYAEADAGKVDVWTSRTRTVTDGTVTFAIATKRTWGMSVTVDAPWEGQTGYATTVAWRYNGEQVGDEVTLEQAVTKKRASACWEGVRRRIVTVPLVVEEVEVDGVRGRVPGSIAFVPETQAWLTPMRKVWDGVLGSQDVNICR